MICMLSVVDDDVLVGCTCSLICVKCYGMGQHVHVDSNILKCLNKRAQ